MYQRLSAHISSVDIPDFSDLKESARETATRVETALLARSSSTASNASLEQGRRVNASDLSNFFHIIVPHILWVEISQGEKISYCSNLKPITLYSPLLICPDFNFLICSNLVYSSQTSRSAQQQQAKKTSSVAASECQEEEESRRETIIIGLIEPPPN
jgi:hypothetical protein